MNNRKPISTVMITAEAPVAHESAKISAKPIVSFDAAKRTAEIFLFAGIGDHLDGITAKAFGDSFAKMGPVDEIDVYINSPGGDVFQGNTIYNLLKNHKAKKTVHVCGLAASIASIIAMAGDEIRIAKNGFFFIHDAQATTFRLNAAKMRRTADELDLVSEGMAATYAERSGMNAIEVRKMMRSEVLMNADRAIELGLADKMMDPAPIDAMMPHLDALSADNAEIANQIKASLGEADKKNEQSDESGQNVEHNDSESRVFVGVTDEEIKERRESMDLAFFMAERKLREAAERAGR